MATKPKGISALEPLSEVRIAAMINTLTVQRNATADAVVNKSGDLAELREKYDELLARWDDEVKIKSRLKELLEKKKKPSSPEKPLPT